MKLNTYKIPTTRYNWYCMKCWKRGQVEIPTGQDPRKLVNVAALHTCLNIDKDVGISLIKFVPR